MTNAPTPAGMAEPIHGTPQMPVGVPEWCAWATTEIERLRAAQPSAGAEPERGVATGWVAKSTASLLEEGVGGRFRIYSEPQNDLDVALYTHPAPVQTDSGGVVEALRNAKRLALQDADALERTAEDAEDNQWDDWGATMRQAAGRIRTLAALAPVAAESGEKDKLRTLLDNLVIAQGLSKAIREHATNEARAYLCALRTEPTGGGEG